VTIANSLDLSTLVPADRCSGVCCDPSARVRANCAAGAMPDTHQAQAPGSYICHTACIRPSERPHQPVSCTPGNVQLCDGYSLAQTGPACLWLLRVASRCTVGSDPLKPTKQNIPHTTNHAAYSRCLHGMPSASCQSPHRQGVLTRNAARHASGCWCRAAHVAKQHIYTNNGPSQS
jgi:hypothetical protein